MDTLALLCNLHADGPATLHKLRRAGCDSLRSLLRLGSAGLAVRLSWEDRVAERFLREAELLVARLDQELDDAPEAESDVDEREEFMPAGVQEVEEPIESGFAPPPERVAAVLGAWRELDRVSPPAEPAEYVVPRPPDEHDRELCEVPLAGLDAALRGRLSALGVRSLRGLLRAPDLELARALPLGFSRVKHLQFLAARELSGAPRSGAEAEFACDSPGHAARTWG